MCRNLLRQASGGGSVFFQIEVSTLVLDAKRIPKGFDQFQNQVRARFHVTALGQRGQPFFAFAEPGAVRRLLVVGLIPSQKLSVLGFDSFAGPCEQSEKDAAEPQSGYDGKTVDGNQREQLFHRRRLLGCQFLPATAEKGDFDAARSDRIEQNFRKRRGQYQYRMIGRLLKRL